MKFIRSWSLLLVISVTGAWGVVAPSVGASSYPCDPLPPGPAAGYRLVAADGGVFSFGHAPFWGSTGTHYRDANMTPVVGMASYPYAETPGYWLAGATGAVYAFGGGDHHGVPAGVGDVVGIASTPTGGGYWLVAADGGVFSFGDAGFFGSTGGMPLNHPVVGMAPTHTGRGYWLVAADGGVFTFGDARFSGSAASRPGQSIVAMAPTPSGKGYWLVTSGGAVQTFGDAPFLGSMGSGRLNRPVVGLAASPTGLGYWLVASDGGVFAFGDAGFFGSTGSLRLNAPIVGFAPAPAPRQCAPQLHSSLAASASAWPSDGDADFVLSIENRGPGTAYLYLHGLWIQIVGAAGHAVWEHLSCGIVPGSISPPEPLESGRQRTVTAYYRSGPADPADPFRCPPGHLQPGRYEVVAGVGWCPVVHLGHCRTEDMRLSVADRITVEVTDPVTPTQPW